MSITVENIGLFLSNKTGNRSDYKLRLSLYMSNHDGGGIPDGSAPLVSVTRQVDDIDHLGWYVFNFPFAVILPTGFYSITLHQEPNDETFPVDFKVNFVQWLHDPDKTTNKGGVSSFSSDLQFTSDVYGYGYGGHGLGSEYGQSLIYGYGYGYSNPFDSLDFFNIIGVDGDNTGYAISDDPDFYGYAFGFENVTLATDDVIQRNFKIYEKFNDIEFRGDNSVKINIPAADETVLTVENRQEFLAAEQEGTAIVNDFVTLRDFGDRIISADTGPLNSDCVVDNSINWFGSNFGLSGNDVVYADIVNPIGNANQSGVYLVTSNFHSGVFLSIDAGSSWDEKNTGLTLSDNSERNFSCIKFGPGGSFIIAFDDTNDLERGKVFKSTDLGETWSEVPSASADLSGITVNDAFVVDDLEIWIGTSEGVFRSLDGGDTWSAENTNLPPGTNVNQILVDLDVLSQYGFGYGGGEGISFFDVFNFDASFFGYGFGSFEMDFANAFGYGYGYEYGFSGGSSRIVAIATEIGAYWLIKGVWGRLYPEIGDDPENTNSILFANDNIYVAKDDGVVRSEIVDFETDPDRIRFRGHDPEDALSGEFYITGLLRRKSTKIRMNRLSENEVFISQHGGVFLSTNDGGNFVNLTKLINERSLKIKDILLNPINNNIVYAIVETTKFANAGVTFLMDCTGSMVANDPNEKRIDMALNIVDEIIACATNTPYFQIIRFGVSEQTLLRNQSIYNALSSGAGFDHQGAFNLTKGPQGRISDAGFSSNATLVRRALDVSCREPASGTEHARTIFFDALDVTSTGLANFGSRWTYNQQEDNVNIYKYKFDNITSNFYTNLDKSLIIVTDGNDTVDGKTLQDLISSTSNYDDIPADIYIVGVGHNINYENLDALRDANQNAKLYLAPFEENIFSTSGPDVGDIILNKEKFRRRTGTWSKLIDLGESKITKNVFVKANVPPTTTLTYKIRASDDKKTFSNFTSDLSANTTNSVNISGKYIQIVATLDSLSTSFAPEIDRIDLTILEPSNSFVYFPLKNTDSSDRISEIELSSLDDASLDNVSNDIVKTQFGIVQSESTNFDFFDTVHRDKRSVLLKRELEDLATEDGFFFTAKNGPWSGDAEIQVIDFETFSNNPSAGVISTNEYFAIPSEGLIVFFDKVPSTKTIKLDLTFISQYRVGLEIKNLNDTTDCFLMHDIAWTFYTDSTSVLPRPALPKVESQLADLDTFGILSPENHPTSFGQHTTFLVQYILPEDIQTGTISVTTGQRLNLDLTGNSEDIRFYNQNTFFATPQITNGLDRNFLRALDNNSVDFGILTIQSTGSDVSGLHWQANATLSNPIDSGESIVYSIGDRSQGSLGIQTEIFQENLLFNNDEKAVASFRGNYFIGQETGAGTPSLSDGDFNRIITPSFNLIGTDATRLVILAPTTADPGGFFTAKILAVDEVGLIDENFTGTIQFGVEDTTSGTFIDGFSKQFSLSDEGVLDLTVFVSATASGSTRLQVAIVLNDEQASAPSFSTDNFDQIFFSNTILFDSSTKIRWGDLNVSTIFTDGRQDIDFVADYAKNVSLLDFVGIGDDVDFLETNGAEWTYILSRTDALTINDFVVIPGFRHRSSDFYGERLVLFNGTNEIVAPQNITTQMQPSNSADPQTQILNLIDALTNKDYITLPVHSPYKTDQLDTLFRGRGFIYDRYRNILQFSSTIDDFVTNKEVGVEIYSEHGNTETPDFYQSENFLGSDTNIFESSAYVQRALQIGKRFGFTAASGGFHSRPGYYKGDSSPRTQLIQGSVASVRGLTAVRTNTLDRSSIISKIKNRECYSTTGARMFLSFEGTTQGQTKTMGGIIGGLSVDGFGEATDSITFTLRATSDNAVITRIEIIKILVDGDISTILDSRGSSIPPFNKVDFGNDTGELDFTDSLTGEMLEDQELCYYLKITQDDGHFAWSSPIWFNYGREDGIRDTNESNVKTVFQPSLSSEQGDIPEVPYSLTSDPPAGLNLPAQHINSFFPLGDAAKAGGPGAERVYYFDKNLYVSENNINLAGTRLIEVEDGSRDVIYGTHFLKMISSQSEFSLEAKSPLSGNNGSDPNGADDEFKYLNDGPDDTLPNRPNFTKRHRSFLFGHMWQYLSDNEDFRTSGTFSFEGDENNNSIHVPNTAEKTKVIMKPSMIEENGRFYIFYSSSVIQYPERPEAGLGGVAGLEDTTYLDGGSTVPENILAEEVVGFNILNDLNDWGSNMRIHYARGINAGSRDDFSLDLDVLPPNTFGGSPILFAHSPHVVKVDDDPINPFRLYYLGWHGNPFTLKIFVHSFSDIENPSSGTTTIAFSFEGQSDFSEHNFVPYNSNDGFDDDAWPEDPYYALDTNWLSVARFDDGNYYAFFNFENTGPKNSSNVQNPATAVLFSFDGINFFEKNPSNTTEKLDTLPVRFAHPFKKTISGQTNWYIVYQNSVGQAAYARINWTSKFETNINDL